MLLSLWQRVSGQSGSRFSNGLSSSGDVHAEGVRTYGSTGVMRAGCSGGGGSGLLESASSHLGFNPSTPLPSRARSPAVGESATELWSPPVIRTNDPRNQLI